ncbi:branched-chain amino acid aminotransferase [Candidatus Desantisbacteria bacterium CG_4_8_14_3_um_filter_40_12]|uniref:Branched-chain amino acid aminotransferase n=1 Tax=Candidatus Desantisbacteria bacterium CG_4_8_14_3_um_filter_40_12 TaxID=1974545 RepID=A0A2M7JDY7_9BACT|nr:MAG: branched-chain amino acid aminotransferase [Candidatus Desantisbacteria bacterium CG_4_8_14_3_um_filter_40_12]
MTIYLNGKYIPKEQARYDLFFDGGVFETMRAYGGKIFKLSEHIKRLFMSAKFLGMNVSYVSEEIEEICCNVLENARLERASVRISIANGNLMVIVSSLPVYPQEYYEKGVLITTTSLVKQPPMPQAKSSNFLPGVIARAEANRNNPFEVVFLNHQGFVTEGTVSNIFMVKNGLLITPPPYLGLLNGITRQCVLEIAMQTGMRTRQVPFTRYDLFTADEVFLTNSTIEILPVSVVDGRMVGDGMAGKISRGLREGYWQMVEGYGQYTPPDKKKFYLYSRQCAIYFIIIWTVICQSYFSSFSNLPFPVS